MPEMESHEAVEIFIYLPFIQLLVPDAFVAENVIDFGDLGVEVEPFLRVVLYELSFLGLLCDYEIGGYLGKLASREVCEIAPGQELRSVGYLVAVFLSAEYVLFLECVPLAESLHYIGEDILKEHVLFGVGAEPEHRVHHAEYHRGGALGVEQHDIAVCLLQLGENAVKYFLLRFCHVSASE